MMARAGTLTMLLALLLLPDVVQADSDGFCVQLTGEAVALQHSDNGGVLGIGITTDYELGAGTVHIAADVYIQGSVIVDDRDTVHAFDLGVRYVF